MRTKQHLLKTIIIIIIIIITFLALPESKDLQCWKLRVKASWNGYVSVSSSTGKVSWKRT